MSLVATGASGRALEVAWPVIYDPREENTTIDSLATEYLTIQLETIEAAVLPTK